VGILDDAVRRDEDQVDRLARGDNYVAISPSRRPLVASITPGAVRAYPLDNRRQKSLRRRVVASDDRHEPWRGMIEGRTGHGSWH
jgi:hypothetical protein